MYTLSTYIDNKHIRTTRYMDEEEAQLDYEYFMLHSQGSEYVRYELKEIGGLADVCS